MRKGKKSIGVLMAAVFVLIGVLFYPKAEAAGLVTLTPMNQWTNWYENHYAGYAMQVPASMKRDETALDVRSRFYNEGATLDIFYDDFRGEANSFASYHNYGNKSLFKKGLFQLSSVDERQVGGSKAKVMYYSREKFSVIKRDRNYYASAEIPRSNKEVITVILKSEKPITQFDSLLNTFEFREKREGALPAKKLAPVKRKRSSVTERFMEEVFSKQSGQQFGIFEPSAPGYLVPLENLQKRLNYDFPVLVRYQKMDDEVPYNALKAAKNINKVLELTLQTTRQAATGGIEDVTAQILKGEYAGYFKRYAEALKKLDHPVLFRLNNEMNGDWCKYSAYHYGKDADLYIELYRYIFEVFREEGVDNVLFVWNPNERSFPQFAWNHAMAYYPGDDYVDIVGLTGYNTGNYYRGEHWRSFEEIYDPLYQEYVKRFDHPLMITEFASSSYGGDKAHWMKDMFDKMKKYDRIKLAIWWSGTDWDGETPARTYRIDENEEVLDAAKEGLHKYKRVLVNRRRSLREEY